MDVHAIYDFSVSSGLHGFMYSAYGWPFIESLHFIGLAVLLGSIGLFDLRALGVARGMPLSALHRLVPFGVAAFALNVITGLMFIISAPDQYLYNPSFQLKLGCMAIAGVNVAVFYTTLAGRVKAVGPDDEAPLGVKIIAAVSLASWIMVIVFGRLITMFRPPYHWCAWCT